jgi:hypothetical protein
MTWFRASRSRARPFARPMLEALVAGVLRVLEWATLLHQIFGQREARLRRAEARAREDVDRVNAWLRMQGVPSRTSRERDL